MTAGLDELTAAVDALSALDVDALAGGDLHELVVGIARQEARLAAAKARVARRWEADGQWAQDGSRTAATALSRDTMTSHKRASAELHRARALASMPATAAALAEGRFSTDYVDLLVRADQPWRTLVFAEHEAMLVEQIAGLRFEPARRLVADWMQRADADAADERAVRDHEHAYIHASATIDGRVVIDGVPDPTPRGDRHRRAERLEHALYLADRRAGIVRTASQRRADAFVEMARRSTAATGTPARPSFTVVGDESLTRLCELGNGTVIAPLPWMSTAMLESVIFDGPSTIISVSDKRTFTGKIRRAIQVRDRHCRHAASSDVPAERADVDHLDPQSLGGPTSQFNGRSGCPPHNRHPDKRDDPTPRPYRAVDRLDELRARLRWRILHGELDDPDDAAA